MSMGKKFEEDMRERTDELEKLFKRSEELGKIILKQLREIERETRWTLKGLRHG